MVLVKGTSRKRAVGLHRLVRLLDVDITTSEKWTAANGLCLVGRNSQAHVVCQIDDYKKIYEIFEERRRVGLLRRRWVIDCVDRGGFGGESLFLTESE